jgi:hypothetical protein
VRDRTRLRPLRILAIALAFPVAGYFLWAAVTDRPAPKLAWFAVVAIQFLNVAILLADRRDGERDD